MLEGQLAATIDTERKIQEDRIRKLKDEKHMLKQVSRGAQAPDFPTLNPNN
jgi:hypothetical protein